jgi:hypothetical protein
MASSATVEKAVPRSGVPTNFVMDYSLNCSLDNSCPARHYVLLADYNYLVSIA